jgi:hypothetical protein
MAKTRTDGGVDAPRRKRLEALRDDCRRHDQCAVEIAFVEVEEAAAPRAHLLETRFSERWCTRVLQGGRSIEMALWGAEDKAAKNAVAYLARLGRELAEMGVSSALDIPDLDYLAMFELAMRAPSRKSWVPPTMPPQVPPMPEADYTQGEGEMKRRIEEGWKAAGFIEKIERKVPDVRAAIAELCDELLEVKPIAAAPKRKRANPGALWHDAVKTLKLMRQAGQDPSDHEIAKALGVSKATFSRHVGSKSTWTDERAGRLGTARRQASRDPDTWGDR